MFTKETYTNRRKSLKSKIDSGILLFLGTSDAAINYAGNAYKFRQDSTFNYFFGLASPDFAAIIDLDSGEEIIFGNDVTIDDIIWMGPQRLLADRAAEVGVSKTLPLARLEEYIGAAKKQGRKVHFLPPYRNQNMITLHKLLDIPFEKMREMASVEFIKGVAALRLIKEDCEIAEIDKACDIGTAMHEAAIKMIKLGVKEQEIVGVMEGIAMSHGLMPSFNIILSQNGETLHNHMHHQTLTEGRLLLVDAGAETNSNYTSDFTRTWPCSGKFTQKQKEIYTIVSDAEELAFQLCRPGITYSEVHIAMAKVMAEGLVNIGLMKGNVDDIVACGAQSLFMPHGLGHNMGMDVHDMEDFGENYIGYDDTYKRSTIPGLKSLRMGKMLEVGHVITDEPGIYFIPALIDKWKSEGINRDFICFDKLEGYYDFGGIRLEDDILITKDGSRLMGSKRLPHTVEEVEEAMRKS